MTNTASFLMTIDNPEAIITPIISNNTYPEFLEDRAQKYGGCVELFANLIFQSSSSAELLEKIRTPKAFDALTRMSLLKLFRRCVSSVIDTEKSKKISIPTSMFIENYGYTFKDIHLLKSQFAQLTPVQRDILCTLIGEYDDRGKQGYILTDRFFSWFENTFAGIFTIEGPRGAGSDIQLKTIFSDVTFNYPCDFVIRDAYTLSPVCIGFARYDSTRGGSQSDDRTGGNSDKVSKVFNNATLDQKSIKILFLSDGPGLTHRDTWEEACILDGQFNDKVRVSTLKLASTRITESWLRSP